VKWMSFLKQAERSKWIVRKVLLNSMKGAKLWRIRNKD
jgi:hypothetical protein